MRRLIPCLAFLFLAAGLQANFIARGPWVGGVTDRSAVVVAKLGDPAGQAQLDLSETADFAEVRSIVSLPTAPGHTPEVVRFVLGELKPSTLYHYRFRPVSTGDEEAEGRPAGTFQTFPEEGRPASFRFAFGSCADTGSAHAVFQQIRRQRPLLFLSIGDLHYENIAWNHRPAFRAAYDTVLASATQRQLYRAVPVAYTWDDHDFGPNGSDRHSPSRPAALATYREYVPHYPLAWEAEFPAAADKAREDGPIAQAFTVGRARFIMLDTRSQRDSERKPDGADKTMLGAWQKEWLKRELLATKGRFPLVFIVSSVSWVSNETNRRDNWGRYATERAELSDWMVTHGITGVCFLSGDAHMLAADDGRHNRYGRKGGPGFPALQAGPLDKSGSIKGGPWSVAPVLPESGEGQFGLVDVTDHGDRLVVLFRGLNHEGTEKLRLSFTVPAR